MKKQGSWVTCLWSHSPLIAEPIGWIQGPYPSPYSVLQKVFTLQVLDISHDQQSWVREKSDMEKVNFSACFHSGLPLWSSRAVHDLGSPLPYADGPCYPGRCLLLAVSLINSLRENVFCCILLAVIYKMFMLTQNPCCDHFIGCSI